MMEQLATHSGIYCGTVMHRRVRPRTHYLRYGVFYLLLDLDELPRLNLRLLGVERSAPFSFRARDHGDGSGDLKSWVRKRLVDAGIDVEVARISLLSFPCVFGFVFNPISVYFCYGPEDRLAATLYEVNNTFGGRHIYALAATAGPAGTIRQSCAKRLYVSPFNDVSGFYRFAVRPPSDKIALSIDQHDAEGHLLQAAFAGKRHDLTDRSLLRLLLVYPFLTLKVVAGIHWEALKLWLKGVPLHKRPQSVNNPSQADQKAPGMRGDNHGGVTSESEPARAATS
ncbi:DUF1365 domain-containing protein [Dongia mobilis]|jgi:DUF1365 family protein|uniref:DUF1365 domain-containing protein n=1 Tax=Dongia sp. TaxID=1977262 RepID=UPI0026ED8789